MQGEPNPNSEKGKKADADTTMTLDKFNKLSYSEQKEWKDAHLEEYHKLYNN